VTCEGRVVLHFPRLGDLHDADDHQHHAQHLAGCHRRKRPHDDRSGAACDQQPTQQDEQQPMGTEQVGDEITACRSV